MPEGEKVGDAYIEIHAELDKSGVAKAERELEKTTLATQKKINQKLTRNFKEVVQKNHIQALNLERSRIQEIGRLQSQALAEDKKRTSERARGIQELGRLQAAAFAEDRRRTEQKRRDIDSLARLQIAAVKEDFKRQEEAFNKLNGMRNKRSGGKRFKDGGMPGLPESVENIASILPGQLEKLLRNPYVAAAALAVGVSLGSLIIQGAAGAIAAGTAAVSIGGALAILIKKDQDVANAAKSLGDTFVNSFAEAALPLKGPLMQALSSLGGVVSQFFGKLDLGVLASALPKIVQGMGAFADKLAPAINLLNAAGGEILASIANDVLPEIGMAIQVLAGTIFRNKGQITAAISIIGHIVTGAIAMISGLIEVVSMGFRMVGQALLPVVGLLQKAKPLLSVILGEGATRALDALSRDVQNMATAGFNAANGGNAFAGSLTNVTEASNMTGRSLQEQRTAYEDLIAAQQNADSEYRTGLETAGLYGELQRDIAQNLKDNGTTLDVTTAKGKENFETLTGGLRDLKTSYAEDVAAKKISAEEAQKAFKRQADALLANFAPGTPAYNAVAGLIGQLNSFPKDPVKVQIDIGIAAAEANLDRVLGKIAAARRGLSPSRAAAGEKDIAVDRATGGAVFGAGTGTSDSIPANLSNGEFVMKASSARKIGYGTLGRMNATGKAPMGFATGGRVGNGRGSSAAEVKAYNALLVQIAALNKSITIQTKALEAYNTQLNASRQQFANFVNLGALDTEGKSAGDIIGQLQARKAKATTFSKDLAALKQKGLSATALAQIAEAGPDSPLASLLKGGTSAFDVGLINSLLGGEGGYASSIAGSIFPGGAGSADALKKSKAKLGTLKGKAGKLKPVKGKGATISYAGGRVSALFSAAELKNQQLQAGTYVTVMIDGKEVRAIVRQETKKTTKKTNQKMRSGRR